MSARQARRPVERTPASERDGHAERIRDALRSAPGNVPEGRLAELVARFGLTPLDADVLAVLWVCAFEPELRSELARREPGSAQITARSIATLFRHQPRIRLPSDSPLLLWQMVLEHAVVDGGAALTIDPAIVAWLEGDLELDRVLAGSVQLLPPALDGHAAQGDAIARRLHEGLVRGQRWRVHLVGRDALGKSWFAAELGRSLGLPVLEVHRGALSHEPDAARRLHRQAFLDRCIPYVAADDAALLSPAGVPPCPVQIVHGDGNLMEPPPGVQELRYELKAPDAAERERLWRHLLPECAAWPASELSDLALRHEATAGDIAAAARQGPSNATQAAEALRERIRGDLSALVRRMDATFVWSDLVLPDTVHERLQEIAFEARERARVWAEPAAARLFPYGRGLVALFAGPPGTGKTMAAQVIAADLGLDLLAVDLSAIVSKWVGETSQHIQKLLSSPAARQSVLFFDEADALYSKRVEDVRDAQDRFANLDTSHLMTALEAHPGIVLLASNLKGNIDSAFLRRIRHVIDFPKPDAGARGRIWRNVVSALFGAEEATSLGAELDKVARIEATGAVIKNAALSALFAARRQRRGPSARLFAEMVARELAKEGAGLSERELEALVEGAS